MAGLQGLISMGLRLNDEAEVMAMAMRRGDVPLPPTKPMQKVIQSSWIVGNT